MHLVNVAAFCLLSLPVPARQVDCSATARSGSAARDSAAVVRVARAALARYLRRIEAPPPPRYRVTALMRDSLGMTVAFTSCPARPPARTVCVDGGARVRVRPDSRAEVLAIR